MPMSEYMRGLRERVGSRLLEAPAVSIATRDEQGRVLLVRHRGQGEWVVPGGAVEPLEAPADAAVREMWEETGLLVEPVGIVGVYGGAEFVVTYENGDRTSYLIVVFEGRVRRGEPRPDGVEIEEVAYFPEAEAFDLPLPAWMPEVLRDVFHPGSGFRKPGWEAPR